MIYSVSGFSLETLEFFKRFVAIPPIIQYDIIAGVKSIDNWFSEHTHNKTEWNEFSHKWFMGKRDPRTSHLRYDEQFLDICQSIGWSPKINK